MSNNLWDETIDKEGNSSLQIHEVKVLSVGCKPDEHFFVFTGGSRREAVCEKCKTITPFILGLHKIIDGKISTV